MSLDLVFARRYLQKENAKQSKTLVQVPMSQWPPQRTPEAPMPIQVWRSQTFLVQVFEEGPGWRASVNRTEMDNKGQWKDGVTWDQLQAIKTAIGFANHDAVEVYPRSCDVVNVANIRHLWILREPLSWSWKNKAIS